MAGTPSTGYATNTFAIDDSERYLVIAQTMCKRVFVQENYDSTTPATADLLMARPPGATQVSVTKGTPAIFTPQWNTWFFPGEIVGDIETVSGSITVQQIESEQV